MGILKHYDAIGRRRCNEAAVLSEILARVERPVVTMSFATEKEFDEHLLAISESRWASCDDCRLAPSKMGCRIYGTGVVRPAVLVIGDYPQKSEVEINKPFSDGFSIIVRRVMSKLKYTNEDVYLTNLVACAPKSRNPTREDYSACRPRIKSICEIVKSQRVLLLGRQAGSLINDSSMSGHVKRHNIGMFRSMSWIHDVYHLTHPRQLEKSSKNEKAAFVKLLHSILKGCINGRRQ